MAWGKQEIEKRWWRIGVEQVVCGRVSTSKLCMDKLCCMHVCMHVWCMYVCTRMYGWMDGEMDGWMDVWMHININIYIYIYGVKWLQMTQVRQSHPTQTCHSVRKSASDAAEVHAQSMSPSTTHATWNEGGCLQVPRQPRQQPRRPGATPKTKRATRASPVP